MSSPESCKEYYRSHREEIREKQALYYLEHREELREKRVDG
jgi:hypothetical protein